MPEPRDASRAPAAPARGLFVLGVVTGLLGALAIERWTRLFFDEDIERVRRVRDLALEEFVRPVDRAELVDHALQGMLAGLDEHSHYYDPAEIPALDRETSGEFVGIGVEFRAEEPGRILYTLPESPAERAGLTVGDRVVEIDGTSLDELADGELEDLLGARREIRLRVEGLDSSERWIDIEPDVVLDPTVRHARMLDSALGIGYLWIRSFSHRTLEEFDDALESLRAKGLNALVLDLRANPGGILDAAVSIANRFVASGPIVATRARAETRVTDADEAEATFAGLPLVVLLDSASASASEVLAAALQDHAVAAIVGEPSYGKGTVQTLRRIGSERAVVKLTTALYCSPSLRRIEHDEASAELGGIAPDLWVPLPREERDAVRRHLAHGPSPPDAALAALRAWEEQAGEKLIEEPPPDRQLVAALALLGSARAGSDER